MLPFSPKAALLRGGRSAGSRTSRCPSSPWTKKAVWRCLADERVELTAQELALLLTLMENPDLPVSREHLLRKAWGYQSMGETRTVDVHVQRLRRKLGMNRIETVYPLRLPAEDRLINQAKQCRNPPHTAGSLFILYLQRYALLALVQKDCSFSHKQKYRPPPCDVTTSRGGGRNYAA